MINYKNVDKYKVIVLRFSLRYLKTAKNWHPLIYLRVFNTYVHCFIKTPRLDIFQNNILWIGLLTNPDISCKIYWGWPWGLSPNYGIVPVIAWPVNNKDQIVHSESPVVPCGWYQVLLRIQEKSCWCSADQVMASTQQTVLHPQIRSYPGTLK